eukprot:TRINITY_DN2384_c0_g1_i2.p1 TRINITY_DN2384_c0_g1~~TRINITY_DN2384_c0_g1_i2.p1  ORF type:complete len:687 (-),score=126.58 TRINITY_DN2384_c0_g1_i2:60-1916(-)
MNKLWVRMQHQGPARDKQKREKERQELRLLVGKNLARLSQLEGVDVEMYTETVLPRITEQIVNCKDQIAQQYLMEIIIQVFPDNFHLATLEIFLETCGKLLATIDVKTIVVSLVDRLAAYATQNATAVSSSSVNVFKTFSSHIASLLLQRPKMDAEDQLAMQVALLNLALRVYPETVEYVDEVLNQAFELLTRLKKEEVDYTKPNCVKHILSLLNIPLTTYNNIIILTKLENYSNIIGFLGYSHRRKIAIDVVSNAINNETFIPEPDDVTRVFAAIKPLLMDEEDQGEEVDPEDFEEDQNRVAALIHLFQSDNLETLFMLYATSRKVFGQGGNKRIKHTLPPLVFRSLKLAALLKERTSAETWERVGKRIFKFAHETVLALARTDYKDLAMRLFLQCAKSASYAGFETIAYEFLTQVFEIYESDVADSKAQFRAINEIIATLQTLHVFSEENYDTLATKTAVHSAKLLKKPDQCRAVYMCSHLFWTGETGPESSSIVNKQPVREYREGKRVLECLQKSLRIADSCMDSSMNVKLFVEILNEYLYYFEHRNETVAVKYVTGLIALIKTNLANMEVGEGDTNASPDRAKSINTYYFNTLKHIQFKKEAPTTTAPYDQIDI